MRRRVPFVPQMEAVECGAASLAMVLAYHGHHAPLSEVRQACGISRDGSTALNLVVAARTYGLEPVAQRLEPSDLADCEGPAILHWEMNHFVVLEDWSTRGAWIADPGVGRRFVPQERFGESFTGICLQFRVGENFRQRPRARVSAGRYFALLRGARRALAMVLVASLALDVLATVVPLTTQVAIDQVLFRHRVGWLGLVGASAAALVTFSLFWALLRGSLLARVKAQLDVAITRQFVDHLFALPLPFFAQRTTADLMSRVQANRTIRDLLAGHSVSLLADGVMLLAYLAIMFVFDGRLTWLVLLGGMAYVVVFIAGRPLVQASADEVQRKDVIASSALLSILCGIVTLKSAGVERSRHRLWLNTWISSLNANARAALRRQRLSSILLLIQVSVPIAVLYLGGKRVLDGDLTPGRLVGFQMLQAGFLGPLQGVVQTLLRLSVVPVLLGRMDDVLLSEKERAEGVKSPRLKGEISLSGVGFRYGPTSRPVLHDVSLRIESGQKVALVGPSGSGKSTLARLLLGLYAPTEGAVLLDGHDLATLDLASVRRQYGVVLQETALFDGSVADNLRLFSPGASQEHVVHAARVAQIHEDILALPHGYETHISGTSGALSGGQRQRLALARAIVHRPPIMILDEATSALDSVTESAIDRYLSTRACTRVVIAHRLSTVRDADIIFVLDGGRIVERGRHAELLAAEGLYARLVLGEETALATSTPPPSRESISSVELGRFDALSTWSDDERSDLAEQLVRVDVARGTRIVEQDARASGLYFITEGTVKVELAEPGLAAWTVAELGQGALFGEIGLLDGSANSASVVAETDVGLLHLPYARFQDLYRRGDILAARATLSLGAIVSRRMLDALDRHAQVVGSRGEQRKTESQPRARSPRRPHALSLRETLLGASLDAAEIEVLDGMGQHLEIPPGGALFRQGAPADTLFVVRRGHVALQRARGAFAEVDPGGLVGETSAFDGGPHAASAVALDDVTVLALARESLVGLLLSGQRIAQKLLPPITEALVRRFRLANYRLREAVAIERGELDRAHAAREDAREAVREEREALEVRGGPGVPEVRVRDTDQSAAACLVALVRAVGRPISLSSVIDAFSATPGGEPLRALPGVARSLGLACRPLDVPLADLSGLDAPLLAVLEGGRMVVLEGHGLRGWTVMDPLRARGTIPDVDLRAAFTGHAFEVRDESAALVVASLPERVGDFARARLGDLGRLLSITLLLQAVAIGASLATAFAVERVFPTGDLPLLGILVAAGASLAVTSAVMSQLQARAIEHLRAHFDREIMDQLMTQVLKLPIAFFDRIPPGGVLQRFLAFENVRALFSTQGVAALLSVASLVVGAVLLAILSAHLLGIALFVLLVFAATTRALFPALRSAASEEISCRAEQQDRLIELLRGIVTLRMTGDTGATKRRWFPAFLRELDAALRQDRILARAGPLLDWCRAIALVAAVWLGARDVLHGAMSIGGLVAFLAVLVTFLGALHALALQILESAPGLVDYGLVRSTFAEPREQAPLARSPGQLRGRIVLDHVAFRYADDGPLVLSDVSLEIASGMKVALVGASGSGKSTLGRLLLGLYLPTSGRILFDGQDVRGLDLEALRRGMGVVLQDPFLVAGSIRENIGLGAEGATMDRIILAAQQAAMHDDIEKMPMGYETLVSEGGGTFSGGQRQRIVIARALVSSPAVLLLDEATSALDNLSQAVIERHLSATTATRIVIAHRLSTVVDADLIVVLSKGSVVEQGTHAELMLRQGAYADLVRAQL